MSNAAVSDDEQIEEFDSDDDESGSELEPITTKDAPKSTVFKNPDFYRRSSVTKLEPPSLLRNISRYKGKNSEKKITINIKTPLIIDDRSIEKPKSPINVPEEEVKSDEKEPEKETQKIPEKSTDSTAPDYTKHLSYEGSVCIYTEPGTGRQLVWNAGENAWVSRKDENHSQSSRDSDNSIKPVESVGDIRGSKIPETTEDPEAVSQEPDEIVGETKGPDTSAPGGIYGFEGDTHTYTDPNDDSVYVWDKEKSAWFPKVDDEFLARYQMSYGFTDPSAAEPDVPAQQLKVETKAEKEQRKAEAKRKAQEPSTWFEVDEAHNTAVYITGLPLDITMEELTGIVTKFGLLARDDKAKDKIKLYRDKDGQPKGDALVTYIKVESVNLALHLLDGSQIRGNTLSVQRAKFQMKGKYDPALKPKRKKKDKERAKKIHEKLFDWRPERMRGEPQKCERVVVIKNLFSPEDFDKDVTLLLEYQQDLRAECAKCGDVKKVVLYDRHPEGVAQVTFKEPAEAQACIQLLNGRWFAQKQISAEIWDGKTKYKIAETDAEIEERIAKWDKFLDDEDDKKEAAKKKAAEDEGLNVHQRSLEAAGLELCGAGGSVPQGQPSSAGSVGSAPSPASPRPTPQPRPPLATTTSQASRTLDDDRSTDAVGGGGGADDSDDGESRAQYVSANCVVFTHYRGDAASEVDEHFQRALAHDKLKENTSPMSARNFPPSFWNSQHPGDVYDYPTDPWHPHYPQYHHRAVHEYHHHNMAAAAGYGGLLLGGTRGLGHHTSHHAAAAAAHHAHAAASYKDWTSATPPQSLVDPSAAPPYPHGPYAPLPGLESQVQDSKDLYWF